MHYWTNLKVHSDLDPDREAKFTSNKNQPPAWRLEKARQLFFRNYASHAKQHFSESLTLVHVCVLLGSSAQFA